jgi:large subunit ribosomal protein L24
MSATRIKKNDLVRVITGKDAGQEGKVLSVDAKKRKVIVEGVNMITKHAKPSATNQQGGIIHREAPIDISNVMYVHKGQTTKIGYTFKDGKKVRVAKKTGDIIE